MKWFVSVSDRYVVTTAEGKKEILIWGLLVSTAVDRHVVVDQMKKNEFRSKDCWLTRPYGVVTM